MNEPASDGALKGKHVITADGIDLGEVDGETSSHIRVRSEVSDAPEHRLWLPRMMVVETTRSAVHLNRRRADLHDAVFGLSPGQQRAYATLEPTVRIGRERWLGSNPVANSE
jgi:hypothetical protein